MVKEEYWRLEPGFRENDFELHFQNDMLRSVIVCQCHGVSDRTIRKAVRDGACSLRQVARASRAGRMCGGCRPAVERLIDEEIGATPVLVAMPGAVAAS